MDTLWPWLAVAGLGALHGLSPANGWMFAVAWGVRARGCAWERRAQVRLALLPIAIGHVASVAIVVCAVAQGILPDRRLVQSLAGALLIGMALCRWLRGAGQHKASHHVGNRISTRAGHAGIALWSCLMATAHGAGLMLVPALVPLCMSDLPARAITASGSLVLALAAVGVHMAAMLATTGVIATGVCRGVTLHPGLLGSAALRHGWTVALAVTGGLLMLLR
ncbi:hypothetical protein N800_03195 [Lysobacter daejeonensis GH1-9]|uniref:Uncharacterized protein n=1 Tax=Lysobacter daejeonensis GH1-9 TaxID=1385517 RepID=A0A0A0EU56_9GAMM|nr:hypothetical protein N800_03195 [Lysobacter daejeonensis GH1-9]